MTSAGELVPNKMRRREYDRIREAYKKKRKKERSKWGKLIMNQACLTAEKRIGKVPKRRYREGRTESEVSIDKATPCQRHRGQSRRSFRSLPSSLTNNLLTKARAFPRG